MLVGSVVGMKSRATGQVRQGRQREAEREAGQGDRERGREEEDESRGAWPARRAGERGEPWGGDAVPDHRGQRLPCEG